MDPISIVGMVGSLVYAARKAYAVTRVTNLEDTDSESQNSGEDDEFLGLRTVYQPSDSEPVIDIVFVHGMGFNPFDTWRSKGKLWPRDFLRDDVHQARVLIYSYSLLLKTKDVPITIQALGSLLLGEVSKSREDEITATRPLIFVAHSFGGLVVKSALAYSQALKLVNHRSFSVSEATMGCCFFGTPHYGMGNSQWKASMSQISSALGTKRMRSFRNLDSLHRSITDEDMALLSTFFSKMSVQLHIAVLSFYEEIATPTRLGKLLVVSERAASLGLVQETRYGLEANHQEMTKFQDSKCLGYVIFLRFLREQITRKGIRSISVPISTIASEQEIQRSILHTKREDDVLEANTLLSPMDEEMSFLSQLKEHREGEEEARVPRHCPENHDNMLWISGRPGSGKSVLAKFLVDEVSRRQLHAKASDHSLSVQDKSLIMDRPRHERDLPIVLKYFFDFRLSLKSDSLTLVKSLFYQLLLQDRQLFQHLRMKALFHHFQNQFEPLKQGLLELLSVRTASLKFVVVDALDECRLAELPQVQELLSQVARISCSRVIVTTRPSVSTGFIKMSGHRLNLDSDHNYIESDIRTYVTSRVREIASTKSFPQDLIEEIISSVVLISSGKILIAKLILQELDSYQPVRSVREVIQMLPQDLPHIYSNTLKRMDALIQAQMIRALYFVMNAKTALNLSRLSALVALSQCERPSCVYTAEHEGSKYKLHVSSRIDIWDNAPAQLERDIQEFCSTMLVINGEEVVLLHSSVREFLEEEKQVRLFLDTFTEDSQDSVPIGDGQGALCKVHNLMAELCLHYIFASHGTDTERDEFDFTDYACLFWPQHLREAGEAVSPRVCNLFKGLLCSERGYSLFWEARSIRNEHLNFGTRSHSSRIATTLSAFDLWEVLGGRLDLSNYDTLEDQNHPGQTPFHVAAAFDAISSIRYIWNHSKRRKDLAMLIKDVNYPLSPLHRAVSNNNLEVVQTLLDYTSNKLKFSDSLFQLVVESGRTDFFDLLFLKTDLTTNEELSSMLCYAIKLKSTKIIQELSNSTSVNRKDKSGNSPLYLATIQGSVSICKILLNRGANLSQVNDRLDTPLHAAADKGDTHIVRLLIEHGARVDLSNRDGRVPLHSAAAAGHTETLKVLLEAGANVFATDYKNETALHLSAKCGGEANVRILLNYGTQINAMDESCRTPLHHAIQSDNASSLPIIYLLLEAGASINIKDKDGMTPLHLAASQGTRELVVELLSLGADMCAMDGKDRGPSECATANGHESIAKLIANFAGSIREERQWSDLESSEASQL